MPAQEIAVGIDIGGTNTEFGLVDRNGNIIAGGRLKTAEHKNAERFVASLHEEILSACKKSGINTRIKGFGIGAPMGNINKGTIEHAAGLPWKGIVPLAGLFLRHTELPVIVTNDANAAAVGEMIFGGARGMRDFVVITLGTGLGSGFVIDGKLVYGHDGFAGEIGHTSMGPGFSNRECGCGKKGCLETYVSATGIKRTLLEIMAESLEPSGLRKLSFEQIDSKIIHDAARENDPLAIRAFRQTGMMLGFKLADVAAHTNPEAIFLFGGLALAGDLILEPARESMEENLLSIYRGKIKLMGSKLNLQNAAVLGASSLIWSKN